METIINWINRTTMYRLMLYYLLLLVAAGAGAAVIGWIEFAAFDILSLSLFFVATCWALNGLLSKLFKVSPNLESSLITGLILSLTFGPLQVSGHLIVLSLIAAAAMASKYILAWRGRHIFNPAGFGMVFSALFLGLGASWWVGNPILLPLVIAGGLLLAYKINGHKTIISFLAVYLAGFVGLSVLSGATWTTLWQLASSPIFFLAFVMLVEPSTSPSRHKLRLAFGVVVAVTIIAFQFGAPQATYGLELSLLIANLIFRFFDRKENFKLTLDHTELLRPDTVSYYFKPDRQLKFEAGQYLELTLTQSRPDNRGVRRFFSISSSPGADHIRITTKFAEKSSSSFKNALKLLPPGASLSGRDITGDFTLPSNPQQKLILVAGGIGITPFIGMLSWLLERGERRPVTMFYIADKTTDFVFEDVLDRAVAELNIEVIYVLTGKDVPADWAGETGFLTPEVIKRHVPEVSENLIYLSGPHAMVQNYASMAVKMGLPRRNVKTDYFPGY